MLDRQKNMPTIATIYCLINPLDRKPFYVGKTTVDLNKRLQGHVSSGSNKVKLIVSAILEAGHYPIIKQLEVCQGYFLPGVRERYWIHKLGKKNQLANEQHVNISNKQMRYYLELVKSKN